MTEGIWWRRSDFVGECDGCEAVGPLPVWWKGDQRYCVACHRDVLRLVRRRTLIEK